jgi:PIN domain nuclease of toxin-antitoxin system
VTAPVLDASALLAYLGDEPGAEQVAEAIAGGATLSSVNLAEVLSMAANRGADAAALAGQLTKRGLLDGAITVEPFTTADAIEAGRLRPLTRDAGLSLGDRACLALARRLATRALTADTTWAELQLDIELTQIRRAPETPYQHPPCQEHHDDPQ